MVLEATNVSHAQTARNNANDENREDSRDTARRAGANIPTNRPVVSNRRGVGNANRGCRIVVVSNGTLGPNIENTQLSTKVMNGRAGVAHVHTDRGSYRLSVDQPLGFSAFPSGGSSGITMGASFEGQGATNFSLRRGDAEVRLKRGMTIVRTHLVASRTNGMPFPAGQYSSDLGLRCE